MSQDLFSGDNQNFIEVQKEEVRLSDDAKYAIKEAIHRIAYEDFNNSIDPIEIPRNWSAHMFVFEDNTLVLWAEVPGALSDLQVVIYPEGWEWRLDSMIDNWH